ncbi:MAG: glycosyltransferase, partial [Candidatus Helarchaeota archaeon]
MENKIKASANVGMLVHGYYPKDVRVRREAEALVEAGFKVTIICLKESIREEKKPKPSKEMVNGVYVYRLPISRKRGKTLRYFYEYLGLMVLGGFRLTISHLINPFQVIHVHNMPDFLVLSGLISKLLGAKLLLDIHDPMPELYTLKTGIIQNKLIEKILKLEEKISCWIANYVISVNRAMYRNLKGKGIPPKKIFIVHNFPDTQYFPIKDNEIRWPRHKNQLVLLYAGTITEHY